MEKRNLYDLLGSTQQSTTEQLLVEYRVRVLSVHPDKQQGQDEEFQLLQQAKEILTDPGKRKHYDTYLSIGSDIPLNEWMSNRERLQQTFHWAAPKQPTPALSSTSSGTRNTEVLDEDYSWKDRHSSTNINAFRNYEI